MKRTTLLTALLLLLGYASMAQQGIDHTLVNKLLPTPSSGWRNDIAPEKAIYQTQDGEVTLTFRNTYSYDEYEFFLTEVLTEMEDLGEWLPYRLETYEVNVDLVPERIVTQTWNDGWVNQSRVNLEYNGTYNPILAKETYQTWENNDWVNQQQFTYDYEPVTTVLVKDWFNDHWGNHYLYTIESENLSATVLLQYWKDGAWQNQEREVYQFDENYDLIERVHANWVNESSWENDLRRRYDYDGPFQLSRMTLTQWENGGWSSTLFKTVQYEHDGMGNSLHAVCEPNYGGGEERNTEIEMFYNESESISFDNVFEVEMSYQDLTAVGETAAQAAFTLCPNPAFGRVRVLGEGFARAEVYSLSGQRLLESHTADLDLQGLATGAYLVKIHRHDGGTEVRKLLVR